MKFGMFCYETMTEKVKLRWIEVESVTELEWIESGGQRKLVKIFDEAGSRMYSDRMGNMTDS